MSVDSVLLFLGVSFTLLLALAFRSPRPNCSLLHNLDNSVEARVSFVVAPGEQDVCLGYLRAVVGFDFSDTN